jgi:hypothetical protein
VPTLNIDSIAAEGVTFANGYAANATCAPSRAALMSGRYGTRFGFEFTPTPPGFTQLVALGESAQAQAPLRHSVLHEDVAEVPYEEMGMPAWPSRAMMPINIDEDRSLPDESDDEYLYWSN